MTNRLNLRTSPGLFEFVRTEVVIVGLHKYNKSVHFYVNAMDFIWTEISAASFAEMGGCFRYKLLI